MTNLSKLLRLKKIKAQADSRAKQKAACLMNEMDQAGELSDRENSDCPAAGILTSLSPIFWETNALLDDAILGLTGTPEVPAGSSSNS